MERDLGRIWDNETTLEYRQRRAIAKGEDPSKVKCTSSAKGRDEAILKRLFRLYKVSEIPEKIMPMTISWLGNSSVATVPTLLDLIVRGEMDGQEIGTDDVGVFASVGAGMNVNAFTYRWP